MFNKLFRVIEKIKTGILITSLRIRGAKIGSDVRIYGPVYFIGEMKNLNLGDRVVLNHGVIINCRNKVVFGSDVHLSAYCQIQTAGQFLDKLPRSHYSQPIEIEDNCWLASGTIVTAGSRIKRNCVIGANSVVFGEVEESSFFAGAPAKLKKKINYI